jgi:hypothetical protein
MFEKLACTCVECERELDDSALRVVYRTPEGERRAYECGCGAVTLTVSA